MGDVINAFKRLPRPQTTPTGLPNHWVFQSRHVPLEPPGDLIVAVHPQSRFQLTAGPLQLPTTLTTKEKAEKMLPYLLQVFVNEVHDPSGSTQVEAKAPWSWSTVDSALAAALEPLFAQRGFPEELRNVKVCSEDEKAISNECWDELLGRLVESVSEDTRSMQNQRTIQATGSSVQLGDETKCHRCQKHRNDAPSPLMKCAACKKTWYCSPQCQKAHWKQHKPVCVANRPSKDGAASAVDAHKFYNTLAHKSAEAKALAATLNLELPSSAADHEGTVRPLRRLVITGKDTAANMQLLFGPQWRDNLSKTYDEVRAQVLLEPPPGSPAYVMAADLDNGAPAWSPRPPSESEQRKVDEVRKMQSAIRERVGAGKSPSKDDMQAILMSFGSNWVEYLALYTLASNTMDQGVQVR
ncbi:hypothetical protein P171DRAFT_516023 [Karstenula rhodostoma CBS 690.94]|uniref:MYND-type domain-containing protein n=1 Tax=Karstenula rhodostoma CBS 690.94 TaxID=1392251 RepID=A0A9P4UIW1_9PLEO|nr:hypothetical protein P171DRAFT_516023 [Karstenula rhodostoma CBS 690.94]